MSVMIGGANPIECGELIYIEGIDSAEPIQYETVDTIPRTGAQRRRVSIYTRTSTPCILGFYEYEILGVVKP